MKIAGLVFAALAIVMAGGCANAKDPPALTLQPPSAAAQNSAEAAAAPLYLGQYYPSGAIYVVPVVAADPAKWPQRLHYVFFPNTVVTRSGDATFVESLSDVYPPIKESMSVDDKCEETKHPNHAYRYLTLDELKPDIDFTDFFGRGMSDNCDAGDIAGKYSSGLNLPISVPLLAFADDTPFTIVTALSGQPRKPTAQDMKDIERYRKDYMRDAREAFGGDTEADEERMSEISTLADATVLFDVMFHGNDRHLRISEWSRASIAQHLYQVFVIDEMAGDRVINTVQYERHQGFL